MLLLGGVVPCFLGRGGGVLPVHGLDLLKTSCLVVVEVTRGSEGIDVVVMMADHDHR